MAYKQTPKSPLLNSYLFPNSKGSQKRKEAKINKEQQKSADKQGVVYGGMQKNITVKPK
tara:strand:+ start:373 stop:549 length:177 start_codon:yes stop_codon:yes gene_type:complete